MYSALHPISLCCPSRALTLADNWPQGTSDRFVWALYSQHRPPSSRECASHHNWWTQRVSWAGLENAVRLPLRGCGLMAAACRMGQNLLGSPASVAFRENTVKSFQQAAKAGAAFIEFDVQVRPQHLGIRPAIAASRYPVWHYQRGPGLAGTQAQQLPAAGDQGWGSCDLA